MPCQVAEETLHAAYNSQSEVRGDNLSVIRSPHWSELEFGPEGRAPSWCATSTGHSQRAQAPWRAGARLQRCTPGLGVAKPTGHIATVATSEAEDSEEQPGCWRAWVRAGAEGKLAEDFLQWLPVAHRSGVLNWVTVCTHAEPLAQRAGQGFFFSSIGGHCARDPKRAAMSCGVAVVARRMS